MRIFIQSIDYTLWMAINNGVSLPTKKAGKKKVKKLEEEYNEEDIKKVEKDAKALNLLLCAIDAQEIQKFSGYQTAKNLWDGMREKYETLQGEKEVTHICLMANEKEKVSLIYRGPGSSPTAISQANKALATGFDTTPKGKDPLPNQETIISSILVEGPTHQEAAGVLTVSSPWGLHSLFNVQEHFPSFSAAKKFASKLFLHPEDSNQDKINKYKDSLNSTDFSLHPKSLPKGSKDDSLMNQIQLIDIEDLGSDKESEDNVINEAGTCIDACGLHSPPFTGGIFTWTGVRSKGKLWRRLDRVLINSNANILFSDISISHLSKTSSDHKPILLLCKEEGFQGPKPFRFLNVWATHHNFLTTVNDYWVNSPRTGGMAGLAMKLKGLKSTLSNWNKLHFGNIFQEVKDNEIKACKAQEEYEFDPNEEKRIAANLAAANLTVSLNREVSFWKQKANIKWMSEGDCNSKFFHSFVKHKRSKLTIRSIQDANGNHHSTQEDISREAVNYFSECYTTVNHPDTALITNFIPQVIDDLHNQMLCSMPIESEIYSAIWALNSDSAAGPDGFNGYFFRTCWHIIKRDVILACQEFFLGIPIPKSFGSTFITLIPKVEDPKSFGDFRPISLSTFMKSLGMDHGTLPFTYLGATMIKVHCLPQSIIKSLHMKMANFLWGFKNGKPKYHWSQWKNICVPTAEGGLGLRSLEDIQDAYSIKLWWKVQTDTTKWAKFMRAKYLRQKDFEERLYDSPVWKRICRIHNIASENCSDMGDQITWIDGEFSLKKAYNICRQAKPTQINYIYCCNKDQIPKSHLIRETQVA
ncbi:unnamed protein product [Cuscuta campestris]|uniref:Reverse transcriptase zinc-binding domain-containing protein n=1 Tax=Cuscuta campestris TaxID=132261 RepID=A0A484NDB6_9ASTE|nr:unnamed protein product [Cuscuta campestris]